MQQTTIFAESKISRSVRIPQQEAIFAREGWSWAFFCLHKNILLSSADAQDDRFITGSTIEGQ